MVTVIPERPAETVPTSPRPTAPTAGPIEGLTARPVPQTPSVPQRLRVGGVSTELVVHLVLALAGSVSLTWLLYERLLPTSGAIGFWVLAYGLFLALFAAASSTTLDRLGVIDRLVGALVASAALILVSALGGIVLFTVLRGKAALVHWNFYHDTMSYAGPDAGLDQGGIFAAIVGTLEQVAISVTLSVPLGIATAIYLSEIGGRLARVVRIVVQAMTAVPTIVAGLFVYALVILRLHHGHSGFAASLALSVSMIPVVTMTSEVVLRLVPQGLREASLALGTTRWQTIRRVVLPTARPGLVTAVLLGVARIIGETSPVLLVAGATDELNANPLSGPQVSLPLFTFFGLRQPLDVAITRAFGSAVVLLALVVFFFAIARLIGGRAPGHMSRRRQRRLGLTTSPTPSSGATP